MTGTSPLLIVRDEAANLPGCVSRLNPVIAYVRINDGVSRVKRSRYV